MKELQDKLQKQNRFGAIILKTLQKNKHFSGYGYPYWGFFPSGDQINRDDSQIEQWKKIGKNYFKKNSRNLLLLKKRTERIEISFRQLKTLERKLAPMAIHPISQTLLPLWKSIESLKNPTDCSRGKDQQTTKIRKKSRTRTLIQLGGLVSMIGLTDMCVALLKVKTYSSICLHKINGYPLRNAKLL